MSTIKVDKLQGTSGAVTGLTFSGANGTFGGTLAVAGVHTVGNNAIYTSDGGAVTQNLVQGLAKAWVNFSYASTTPVDTFNISSLTDTSIGDFSPNFNSNMVNGNFSAPCNGVAINDWHGTETTTISGTATTFRIIHRENNIARDATYVGSTVHGDVA